MENIMELSGSRPRKSTLGFWVLLFEGAPHSEEDLVFADHFHFPEGAQGLARALERVELAKRAGLVARIVHVSEEAP